MSSEHSDDQQPLEEAEQSLIEAERSIAEVEQTLEDAEQSTSEDEQFLRREVEDNERTLDELEHDLRAIDDELVSLAEQNHRYELVSNICRSLEELDNLDAAGLFWDEHSAVDDQAERLRYARQKIDQFHAEIAGVEARREELVDKIGNQNLVLDVLHYDLRHTIEREEDRKSEWLVERDADDMPARSQVMPWARGSEEDRRAQKSVGTSVAVSLGFALVLSMVAIPVIEDAMQPELPERVAKLVRKERTPPPPPVAMPDIPEPEAPEPEPVKELVEELVPDAANQPVVAEVPQVDMREQARSKGILAFRDNFAASADARPNAQLGSQARLSNAGQNAVGRPERMMVTTSAPGSSGGINLSDISRNTGGSGGAMAGVAVSQVASSIGAGNGPNRPLASGVSAGRTDEEIQIVFDRYKAALYRLYNRALRNDPTLRGQMVLRLTIEPDGSVSFCELQSSDMEAPTLADQIVGRVKTFDFGAKEDIVAITIIYPIDFLPAA
ncbi:MAG: AgmX/PglI C-terminal domain-containing protein [Woeseiaceae bacterium]|nr:AgmX/PglI C-terminal domain-containing protein [Woeseiaceae bacterium]